MKKFFLTTVGLLIICPLVYSDVDLSGSAYDEISLISQNGTKKYGNRNAMHLNIIGHTEGIKFVSELEFYTIYGYLASISPETSEKMKDGQFYIDRIYFKFPIFKSDITIGKQRIASGTGILYRPTDSFNKPNPLSLSGRKEGVNGLLAKTYINDLSSVEIVLVPADVFNRVNGQVNLEHLKYSKFGAKFATNRLKSDIAFSYQYNGEPRDHIIGLAMKGDIRLGYHIETTLTYNKDSFDVGDIEDYLRYVIGLDYSFLGKWIINGEYFYNGYGLKKVCELPARDFLLLEDFSYRHYSYFQITYKHDIFLNSGIFLILNFMDRSLIISPNIGYKLLQNADLQVYSQIFLGDKTDEYGPKRLGLNQAYYLKLIVKF